MSSQRWFVGIDPDTDKSGLVLVDKQECRVVYAGALNFPDLMTHLRMIEQEHNAEKERVLIIIEDSDISTNWHVNKLLCNGQPLRDKLRTAAAIGRSAGMCHATLRHLRECAEALGLSTRMTKPLRKFWKGKDGKITQAEASQFMPGLPKRTNQEVRDAALLAWEVAGLPIKLRPTI